MLIVRGLLISLALAGCARSGCDGGEAGRGGAESRPAASGHGPVATDRDDGSWDVVDPYCGMRLRRAEVAATFEYRGTTYSFCMTDHRDAFARDPERYLAPHGAGDAGPGASDSDVVHDHSSSDR